MSTVDSSQFEKTLTSAKQLPPVIALVGEEEALISACLAVFKKNFSARFGEAMLDFNQDILYGDKDDISRVLDACQTLPVGMDMRMAVFHRAEKISSSAQEELASYLKAPNPATALVMVWNKEPKAFPKDLAASGAMVVNCWKMSDDFRRADWIAARFRESGKDIEREAAMLLAREGGDGLLELKGEIEKLVLFAGKEAKIQVQDVRRTLSFRPDQGVWDFINHLEAGLIPKAGRAMERCLEQGEEPFFLLNMMARSARKLVQARPRSAAVQLELFGQIKDSDLALKSGHGIESGVLERMVGAYAAWAS
ncbi:MAG: DNA polymerase III subunit delta [Elusimicrobia bacterium RIFCSPLOWO2_01_FULL_54_10]|nr:MAG: DNA polymerase III subunit delta [Elusimicrobia bacterium RIFCSPLOWO2_01_FULL_54_10]